MANPEHLEILKQGVEVWYRWRKDNPFIAPDLSGADLTGEALRRVDLHGAELRWANLCNADLLMADLSRANLSRANLSGADLRQTGFGGADLQQANLSRANLSRADLHRAIILKTDLYLTDLDHAVLSEANISDAILNKANFFRAWISETVFANTDLSTVNGLETVEHAGPSTIALDTIYRSGGKIPEQFLRGCGLSDWQIEMAKLHQPDLRNEELTDILYRIHDLRAHQAIQISPLFISYTHTDSPFVDEMEKYLTKKGIRFWRDIHHATAGRLETQIDRAIRLNPTMLLVLSSHSVESDWVQHEARQARKLELETKRDVLCPIALDDSWKSYGWPERLREQLMEYNILDFSGWNNEYTFQCMFGRLLEGLDLFYK